MRLKNLLIFCWWLGNLTKHFLPVLGLPTLNWSTVYFFSTFSSLETASDDFAWRPWPCKTVAEVHDEVLLYLSYYCQLLSAINMSVLESLQFLSIDEAALWALLLLFLISNIF